MIMACHLVSSCRSDVLVLTRIRMNGDDIVGSLYGRHDLWRRSVLYCGCTDEGYGCAVEESWTNYSARPKRTDVLDVQDSNNSRFTTEQPAKEPSDSTSENVEVYVISETTVLGRLFGKARGG